MTNRAMNNKCSRFMARGVEEMGRVSEKKSARQQAPGRGLLRQRSDQNQADQ
jgi:hypothetical protein